MRRGCQAGCPARAVISTRGWWWARMAVIRSIAAEVGSKTYTDESPLTFAYYSYWSGVPTPSPTYHMRPGRLILRWPTNDGLTCIYVGGRHVRIRGHFDETSREISCGRSMRSLVFATRSARDGARSTSEVQRTSTTTIERRYGNGWALAGDAGHHKDPTTGFGMSDAFTSAELLARAVHDSTRRGASMDASAVATTSGVATRRRRMASA